MPYLHVEIYTKERITEGLEKHQSVRKCFCCLVKEESPSLRCSFIHPVEQIGFDSLDNCCVCCGSLQWLLNVQVRHLDTIALRICSGRHFRQPASCVKRRPVTAFRSICSVLKRQTLCFQLRGYNPDSVSGLLFASSHPKADFAVYSGMLREATWCQTRSLDNISLRPDGLLNPLSMY